MGYLHHWRPARAIRPDEWEALRDAAGRLFGLLAVLPSARGADGQPLQIAYEAACPNCPPEASARAIRFNGVGAGRCETFFLAPTHAGFEWCKTDGHPYDVVVMATLILAEAFASGWLVITSDGGPSAWEVGRRLLVEAFGPDPRWRIPAGVHSTPAGTDHAP